MHNHQIGKHECGPMTHGATHMNGKDSRENKWIPKSLMELHSLN
jgi:hypothetical protein